MRRAGKDGRYYLPADAERPYLFGLSSASLYVRLVRAKLAQNFVIARTVDRKGASPRFNLNFSSIRPIKRVAVVRLEIFALPSNCKLLTVDCNPRVHAKANNVIERCMQTC